MFEASHQPFLNSLCSRKSHGAISESLNVRLMLSFPSFCFGIFGDKTFTSEHHYSLWPASEKGHRGEWEKRLHAV